MSTKNAQITLCLTGATGYVGRAILRHCDAMPEGAVSVRALARSEKQVLDRMNWSSLPDWLEVIPGRLPEVPDSFCPNNDHVVVHYGVKQIDHDGRGFNETNVEGTQRLLGATNARTLGIIYGSTLSVLGQGAQKNVFETAPMNPQTLLAETRAEAEETCYEWGARKHRSAFGLRPRFILGASDQFVLPGLAKLAAKGQIVGTGDQEFSVISVEDYAHIIVSLSAYIYLATDTEQRALNVGYRQPVSFAELQEVIAAAIGENPKKIKRIPVYRWLPTIMRWLPIEGIDQKATQLELVGFDHSGDIRELEKRIGCDVVEKSASEVVKKVVADWAEIRNHSL